MGVKDEQWAARKRGGRAKQGADTRGNTDSEFINRELTVEETAHYRVWRDEIDLVVASWTELVEGGYRVNTKYDDYSSCCAAFIIPDRDSDNSGYILTGRGGNAYRAVSEAIYKHFVVFRGVWASPSKSESVHRDDDF